MTGVESGVYTCRCYRHGRAERPCGFHADPEDYNLNPHPVYSALSLSYRPTTQLFASYIPLPHVT